MAGARLAVKVVVNLSSYRDFHPTALRQLAWRTGLTPAALASVSLTHQNHPRKSGAAKSMVYTPFQQGIENPMAESVPLSRWGPFQTVSIFIGYACVSIEDQSLTSPYRREG